MTRVNDARGRRGAAGDENAVARVANSLRVDVTGLVSAAFLPNRGRPGSCEKPRLRVTAASRSDREHSAGPELTHFRVIHPIRDGVLRYSPGRLTRI